MPQDDDPRRPVQDVLGGVDISVELPVTVSAKEPAARDARLRIYVPAGMARLAGVPGGHAASEMVWSQ